MRYFFSFTLPVLIFMGGVAGLQNCENGDAQTDASIKQLDGYRGIWFELGQVSEYGDKYSGGLGTYTAKHTPLAIYAEEVNKTFFVYGGTTGEREKYLLCMIGVFDHATNTVSKPSIVYDKRGVDDPMTIPACLLILRAISGCLSAAEI